jgi:hypothetical protein
MMLEVLPAVMRSAATKQSIHPAAVSGIFVAEPAVPGIAEYIRKFWDPRMRSAILAHLNAGGAGLDPEVRDALEALKKA